LGPLGEHANRHELERSGRGRGPSFVHGTAWFSTVGKSYDFGRRGEGRGSTGEVVGEMVRGGGRNEREKRGTKKH